MRRQGAAQTILEMGEGSYREGKRIEGIEIAWKQRSPTAGKEGSRACGEGPSPRLLLHKARPLKEQHGLKDSEPISYQPIPGLILSSDNKKTMFRQILTPRPLPLDYFICRGVGASLGFPHSLVASNLRKQHINWAFCHLWAWKNWIRTPQTHTPDNSQREVSLLSTHVKKSH